MARVTPHVAFLRAVNVGGKNRLPMKDLAAMFEEAGCTGVVTYIQSGNVVYLATEACAARVPAAVEKAIAQRFGLQTPVVTRTDRELRAVARGNPFLRRGEEPEGLHVMFLADRPAAARVALLDPRRSPGDEFEVRGREIYLRFANGAGRTRLTNEYFDRTLATTGTMRNWRTVRTLVEMAGRAARQGRTSPPDPPRKRGQTPFPTSPSTRGRRR